MTAIQCSDTVRCQQQHSAFKKNPASAPRCSLSRRPSFGRSSPTQCNLQKNGPVKRQLKVAIVDDKCDSLAHTSQCTHLETHTHHNVQCTTHPPTHTHHNVHLHTHTSQCTLTHPPTHITMYTRTPTHPPHTHAHTHTHRAAVHSLQ